MLKFEKINLKYPSGQNVLKDISLEIDSCQFYYLIGKSGSGKSTLLNIIARLISPSSGRVLFKNEDIQIYQKEKLAKYRALIGFVFQRPILIEHETVINNILLGLLNKKTTLKSIFHIYESSEIKRAQFILEKIGLSNFESKLVKDLSGGEKQRVAIGRVLLQNPEIILLDESLSSLDPKTSKEIYQLLISLQNEFNFTIILSIHDINFICQHPQKTLALKSGELSLISDISKLDYKNLMELYAD